MKSVNRMKITRSLLGLLGFVALWGCSGTSQGPAQTGVAPAPADHSGHTSVAPGPANGGGRYTEADVQFMSHMIAHHAQAVLIAGWAPSHNASPSLKALCERIVVGQKDEIAFMQNWLRDRHQDVPSGDPSHPHTMPGMNHPMLMPGMLTAEQLGELDHVSGVEFDRLFLKDMIQHHQGALTMVQQLFGTPGAAQDDLVFKFASDMNADQTIEINRMNSMLATLP
jgi:uncharacterized protein (DUF305 family)